MWVRNDNETIKRYVKLPENYKNYIGFDKMDESIHQQEGFFPLIEPIYNKKLQEPGEIFFNDAESRFEYEIIDKVIDLDVEKQRHREDLEQTIREVSTIVSACKNVYDPLRTNPEAIPKGFRDLVSMILPLRQQAIDEIEALSTPEEAVNYVVRGPLVEQFINQLKAYL